MDVFIAIGFFVLCGWVFVKILIWLWPLIKFGAIFIAALFALGTWFFVKESSGIGMVLGAIAVVIAAYNYAKSKST
jgi:hypothetical protein